MKILVAGPGTGKTTRIRDIIKQDYKAAEHILVISFTNATVSDLTADFKEWPSVSCYTLHKYALKINHLADYYIMDKPECDVVDKLSDDIEVDIRYLYDLLKCISFDAMVTECLRFLQSNEAYAKQTIGSLDLLIVDEFQDFNLTERQLIETLATYAAETLILGDDDQTIYGFKDADPAGIISLYETDSVEKLDHLNNCYRCPDAVVECASRLIERNHNRIPKPWNKTGKPGDVFYKQMLTATETNEFIASELKVLQSPQSEGSVLLLSPVGYQVAELEQLLEAKGIAFVDFWNSKTPKAILENIWILRVLYTRRKLLNLIFLSSRLPSHRRKKFKEALQAAIQKDFDEGTFVEQVVENFGPVLCKHLKYPPTIALLASENPEYREVVDQIDQENLEQSLASLVRDLKPKCEFRKNSVNIMSIHKSKGLQADYVFVTGLVDGVLPNVTKGIDTVEAQRRLLYVGITRTIKRLYLISTVSWGKEVHKLDKSQFKYSYRAKVWAGRTSKFVDEMK